MISTILPGVLGSIEASMSWPDHLLGGYGELTVTVTGVAHAALRRPHVQARLQMSLSTIQLNGTTRSRCDQLTDQSPTFHDSFTRSR